MNVWVRLGLMGIFLIPVVTMLLGPMLASLFPKKEPINNDEWFGVAVIVALFLPIMLIIIGGYVGE